MKKFYTRLLVVIASIALTGSAFAQTITFTGGVSSFWDKPGNWDSGIVPNGNDAGATIIIPADKTAIIDSKTTITLSGVKLRLMHGAILTLGNGAGNGHSGNLVLTGAAVVSLESDGVTPAKIQSIDAGNSSNSITINGAVKFAGGTDYSTAVSGTGSGNGLVVGPAHADGTTGFTNGSLALPLTLTGFSANLATGNKINISWKTQQEINTDHFEIQHSADGTGWQTIATVKAAGFSSVTKSYSTSDVAPLKGANLYRLKSVDIDGGFSFSVIVNVRLNLFGKVSVFPNPSVNQLTVSLGEPAASDWTLSIVTTSGQILLKKQFSKDQTTVSLPVNNYPTGHYTVEITDGVSRQSAALMIAHH